MEARPSVSDDTRSPPHSTLLLAAFLPIGVEPAPATRRVELVAATGAVRVVLPSGVLVRPPDRIVRGTEDGQRFREVVGVLHLDAAERQGIPIAVIRPVVSRSA